MVNNLLEEGGSAAMETTEDKIKRTKGQSRNDITKRRRLIRDDFI